MVARYFDSRGHFARCFGGRSYYRLVFAEFLSRVLSVTSARLVSILLPPDLGGLLRNRHMDLWQATEVQRASWTVEVWDTMIRVTRSDYQIGVNRNTQRGLSVLWSKGSRLRMLRYINRVCWDRWKHGYFITLTYPDSCHSYTCKRRSQDRAHFALSLERQLCVKLPIIWRTEFEERKSGKYTGMVAPHHHLMVKFDAVIFGRMVKNLWGNVIGYKGDDLQTKTKKIKGAFGCAKYLAAYVGKYKPLDIGAYHNSPFEFGRQWGVLHPSLIPLLASERFELTSQQKHRAAEMGVVIGLGNGQGIPSGYTVFGADMVEKVISGIFQV